MRKQSYDKLRDIEKFYYKKKKIEYYKLMKKRRRRTYTVVLVIVLIVLLWISKKTIFAQKYSNYLSLHGNNIKINNEKLNEELEEFKNTIDINRVNYSWDNNLKGGNKPEVLVIHHSVANGADPSEIHNWHKEKGYGGIGYHYYIKKDGTIYKGREDNMIGAHSYDHNNKTLAICLDGNFDDETLTDNQKESLINLSISLVVSYNIKDIVGHRDYNQTECPGKNINIEGLREEILLNIKEKSEEL